MRIEDFGCSAVVLKATVERGGSGQGPCGAPASHLHERPGAGRWLHPVCPIHRGVLPFPAVEPTPDALRRLAAQEVMGS